MAESCPVQIKEEEPFSLEDCEIKIEEPEDPLSITGASYESAVAKVKEENGLLSVEDSGTNDSGIGVREIKTERLDASSDDVTSSAASTALCSLCPREVFDCDKIKEEDSEICSKEAEEPAQVGSHSDVSSGDGTGSHCPDRESTNEADTQCRVSERKGSSSRENSVLPSTKCLVIVLVKCDKLLNEQGALCLSSNHDLAVELDGKMLSCPDCPRKYKLEKSLRRHSWLVHSGERPFLREKCAAVFKTNSELKKHGAIHLSANPDQTKSESKRKPDLNRPSVEPVTRLFSCPTCASKFKDNHKLRKHMLVHSDMRPFKCGKCGAAFKRKSHLNRHSLIHLNTKLYACSLCPAKFKLKPYLQDHMRRCHKRNKPFFCSTCSASFARKSNLTVHLATHSKKKIFACTHCLAKFKLKAHLEHHVACHSKKKLFHCTDCTRKFKDNRTLYQHIEMVHPFRKSFVCPNCYAAFAQAAQLKQHLRAHVINHK